jgi:hypothetical protein
MGSESSMLRSINIASNFVMKLHISALKTQTTFPVELYPVIDGIYACSTDQPRILAFVNRVFSSIAVEFLSEVEPLHRFMVRAGLAYGPVIKGRNATQGSTVLAHHQTYCDRILIGMPLTQAYRSEKAASPFGIYLHESVRAFAPIGAPVLSGIHWKWWKFYNQQSDPQLAADLEQALKAHLEWCTAHSTTVQYPKDDIARHLELVKEYFAN